MLHPRLIGTALSHPVYVPLVIVEDETCNDQALGSNPVKQLRLLVRLLRMEKKHSAIRSSSAGVEACIHIPMERFCHNSFDMCGRYRLSRRKQLIEEYFDTTPWDDDWSPRYNIAPTQPVPVIRQHPTEPVRQLSLMKWGLIPNWARDPSIVGSTINARSETAAAKPAFSDPLKFRRCLIPADGFYEWKRTRAAKQAYCFELNDRDLFAFAGLWDGWKNAEGRWIRTFSILTTTSNAVTSTIHDRMPVILHRDSYDMWLDPAMTNVQLVTELLKPYDSRKMRSYPVSTRVNQVVNDDEECSRPLDIQETQNRLFA